MISSEIEQETTNTQPETELELDTWADPDVKRWFEENDVSLELVSDLMTRTVHEINKLGKEEWEKILPKLGKTLFSFWRKEHPMLADRAERNPEGTKQFLGKGIQHCDNAPKKSPKQFFCQTYIFRPKCD